MESSSPQIWKEQRGTTSDEETQITPNPSSFRARRRLAHSPAAKPSCWAYPHFMYVCTYSPITALLPDQPEQGM